jgi:hypothetical protein
LSMQEPEQGTHWKPSFFPCALDEYRGD